MGRAERLSLRGWVASEIGVRVASALVLAAAALLAAYNGGWLMSAFWLVAGLAVAVEWTKLTRVEPLGALRAVLGVGLALTAVATLLDMGVLYGLAAVVAVALAVLALGADRHARLWSLAGFACAALIVVVPPSVREHPDIGLPGVLWMFAVVWTTDVAAYFIGRRFGGPKLWAHVSPKKTWSGFLGGLLAGSLAGLATTLIATRLDWTPVASPAQTALLSAVASVVSQLGDLGESALKRTFHVKDSGYLIPGHGGVMDRLDGFWSVSLLVGLLLAPRLLST